MDMLRVNLIINSPIAFKNMINTMTIFGQNFIGIRVRPQEKSHSFLTECVVIPKHIKDACRYVVLRGDAVFVNVLAFLINGSKGVYFLTHEYVPQNMINILAKSVKDIDNLYIMANFNMTSSKMDR